MLKVGTLIKYLSENNPQETPARLTFFNYLLHLTDAGSALTAENVENFFASCLDFTHWQQNRLQLGNEIQQILQESIDLSEVHWPQDTQVVDLENPKDMTDALQFYLNSVHNKGEKYRLIPESEKKMLAIILMPDKSLCVRSFDSKMIIRHGQLEPLKKDLCLYYTADLELDSEQIQKMEIAPFVTARFQASADRIEGSLVKGYTQQKFFDLKGPGLSAYPKLFYALKRLEQHFINRETDSFYQEMISALERVNEMVKLGDPEAMQESMDVMARAQNALEYVFAGDKLLNLLIRDLQHTLALRKNSRSMAPGLGSTRSQSLSSGLGSSLSSNLSSSLGSNSDPELATFDSLSDVDLLEAFHESDEADRNRGFNKHHERTRDPSGAVVRTPQKVEEPWTQIRSLNQTLTKRAQQTTKAQTPSSLRERIQNQQNTETTSKTALKTTSRTTLRTQPDLLQNLEQELPLDLTQSPSSQRAPFPANRQRKSDLTN